jgi:hypothetical protein
MTLHVCHCKWIFIIGKKAVYGPIFGDDRDASCARMMTRREFKEGYGDCHRDYKRLRAL